MLTITPEAATLIGTLTERAQLPQHAGLRIGEDTVHHSLSMGLAPGPHDSEAVVVAHGARVFLPEPVAHRLDSRVLRAEISPDRSLFFLDG